MQRLSKSSRLSLSVARARGFMLPYSLQRSFNSFITNTTPNSQVAWNTSRFVRPAPKIRCFSSLPPHNVVPMPALSPTMETGSIAKWNLKEGDLFSAGTAICEVETDKATVTYEATEDGILAKILVGQGEVRVGQPIMVTVDDKSLVGAFVSFSAPASAPAKASSAPVPKQAPAPVPAPAPVSTSVPVKTTPPAPIVSSGGRVFASPLARKLARDAGVDISLFQGSGPNGRIVAADVTAGAVAAKAKSQSAPAPSAAVSEHIQATLPSVGVYRDFQVSEAAAEFASRLVHSKQTVPHYYLSVEINLERLELLRKQLNDSTKSTISTMDFFVKASALSMKAVPDINSSWQETFVRQYHQVDVNIVMGAGRSVSIPVIRDVGAKGLKAISKEVADFEDTIYSEDGKLLDPSKVAVGTFSIHNLGAFGIKSAAPIVLPPQSCSLAIGAINDTVVPRVDAKEGDDNWKISPVVTVTLSCDHRVVDGAVGAAWMSTFKSYLENPTTMLL